jgi:AAA domain
MIEPNVPDDLPEYRDNAFIRGLPPIQSVTEAYRSLNDPPFFEPSERGMAAALRRHCVLRLGRYYDPLPRHCDLSANVEMIIRQGYIGRNPSNNKFRIQIQNSAYCVRRKSFSELYRPVWNTATSFCLIGCSGIGKSKCMERVLERYAPIIPHKVGFRCDQIPYVRLDCPHRGSENILCDSFFQYIDRVTMNTNYYERYGGERRRIGSKLLAMAHIAVLHAVGVLVIDEIQHLKAASGDQDALLNFLERAAR